MDMLVDVLNPLNDFGGFVGLKMNMRRFFFCGCKRYCNINGTQVLESHPHLKWAMVSGDMEGPVVSILNIGKTLIPCTWMLRVIHVQDVHNHSIDELCFAISLRVEGSIFSDIGVQQ
jgi:hypothetical protein